MNFYTTRIVTLTAISFLGFVFLLTGCGSDLPQEKALRLAKRLARTGEISDTEAIKSLRTSRELLDQLASIRMEAEDWRRYVSRELINYYHSKEMWPDAVRQAEDLIALQPTNPRWYFLKGRALGEWSKIKTEKVDPALQAFEVALDLDPELHKARYFKALLLGFRKGEVQKANGILKEIGFDLPPTADNRPIMRKARFTLGKLKYGQGKLGRARDVYKSILEMKRLPPREEYRAHKLLGQVYRSLGQKEMALNSFRKARSMYPGDEAVKNALRELNGE